MRQQFLSLVDQTWPSTPKIRLHKENWRTGLHLVSDREKAELVWQLVIEGTPLFYEGPRVPEHFPSSYESRNYANDLETKIAITKDLIKEIKDGHYKPGKWPAMFRLFY